MYRSRCDGLPGSYPALSNRGVRRAGRYRPVPLSVEAVVRGSRCPSLVTAERLIEVLALIDGTSRRRYEMRR